MGRIRAVLNGDMPPRDLLDSMEDEARYCAVACNSLRAFAAVFAAYRREPVDALYRVAICCRATGAMACLDLGVKLSNLPKSDELGFVELPDVRQRHVKLQQAIVASLKDYDCWNIPVLPGLQDSEAPWMLTTSVIAFDIRVWQHLERSVPGWDGKQDIPARVQKQFFYMELCPRYDYLFSADQIRLGLWVIAQPLEDPGRCANPACHQPAAKGRLQMCGACLQARYCSVNCQKADLERHRPVCLDAMKGIGSRLLQPFKF